MNNYTYSYVNIKYNYIYTYMNNKYKYYYNCMYFYFLLNIGLIRVYTINDIKHKNERPRGIVNNKAGIIISKSFSLFVQIHDVILS